MNGGEVIYESNDPRAAAFVVRLPRA